MQDGGPAYHSSTKRPRVVWASFKSFWTCRGISNKRRRSASPQIMHQGISTPGEFIISTDQARKKMCTTSTN